MKTIEGTSNRYLDVNLTTEEWSVLPISPKDRGAYMGGKGLALKIYNDRFPGGLSEIDPLGEENLLIFAMGVMLTTGAPCTGRFEVVTRSPQTNLMLASSCGGPFGEACKTAGWDGVIIHGRSKKPVVLRIDQEGAVFQDAGDLWGMGTGKTQEALKLTVREAAAVIGPAGENRVCYASICSGHRFAGRGGAGAVMGAKNLKAVVARGKSVRYKPALPALFEKTKTKAKKYILRNDMTRGIPGLRDQRQCPPGD